MENVLVINLEQLNEFTKNLNEVLYDIPREQQKSN